MRSGVSLIVIALVAAHRRDAARVDDDAQQIDGFLQVGVAQIERPDDLFLVLAALRRRVGNDGDRARRGHAVEVARGRGHRLSAVFERAVAQVDASRLLAERGSKIDAEVGERAERREDVARAGVAEDERGGQPDVVGEVDAERRRARVRSISVSSWSCRRGRPPPWCAAACGRRAAPGCRRWPGSARRRAATRSAPPRAGRRRQSTAARKWSCEARSLARSSARRASRSSGCRLHRPRVLDDGAVVVLRCSAAGRAQGAAGRAAAPARAARTAEAADSLVARAIGDDVHAPRDAEREHLIG